jgi:hypothetical protein
VLASVALQDLGFRTQQLPQFIGYARPRLQAVLALAYQVSQASASKRVARELAWRGSAAMI